MYRKDVYSHCHEPQHQQINTGRHHCQPKQNEHQTQPDIARLLGQCLIVLQGHIVAEPNRRQCHKTIVETVEVAPSFVARKHGRSGGDDYRGEHSVEQHQIGFGGLHLVALQIAFGTTYEDGDELVETFTDALEHDETERDTDLYSSEETN